MIPPFHPAGVLPPFVGGNPAEAGGRAPFLATLDEVANRFATSLERAEVFLGLLDYRAALASHGIVKGFQWLDGSFVEDCEAIRGRPPADIDVVTFFRRPTNVRKTAHWLKFVETHEDLFDPLRLKGKFKCDAYSVDLDAGAEATVLMTSYWFGLFSHQRDTQLWKGMLRVPLEAGSDETAARTRLTGMKAK